MPIYEYQCETCGRSYDLLCNYEDKKNPSPGLIQEITCCGTPMKEQMSAPAFNTFANLSPEDKKKILKKRASGDFKKNVEEVKRTMDKSLVNNAKEKFSK